MDLSSFDVRVFGPGFSQWNAQKAGKGCITLKATLVVNTKPKTENPYSCMLPQHIHLLLKSDILRSAFFDFWTTWSCQTWDVSTHVSSFRRSLHRFLKSTRIRCFHPSHQRDGAVIKQGDKRAKKPVSEKWILANLWVIRPFLKRSNKRRGLG